MAGIRRSRPIELGTMRAIRRDAPSPFSDLYYRIMEMSWPAFVGMICLAFAIIDLGFGLIYLALPGAVANAQPGSFVDAAFFSVDTLGTVGYGSMYPATHAAHAIAAAEILLGLFFSATITGLIFARFSRPRVGIAFSNVVVVGRYEGKPALMLRVVSMRSHPLADADADAQISWLETCHAADGTVSRRLVELELVRNRNPMLGLAWTLVHILPEDSPMLAALAGDERFMLTAMVRGTDTLLANPTIGSQAYRREDIRFDHEFVDILSTRDEVMVLEMAMLHETRAISDNEGAIKPGINN